jgi:hypothetical protein
MYSYNSHSYRASFFKFEVKTNKTVSYGKNYSFLSFHCTLSTTEILLLRLNKLHLIAFFLVLISARG